MYDLLAVAMLLGTVPHYLRNDTCNTHGISAWSQIIVGGSNFGELLGAASVFILSDYVTTPVRFSFISGRTSHLHCAVISSHGSVLTPSL